MYVRTYVSTYVRMYVCRHALTQARTHARTHACMHVSMCGSASRDTKRNTILGGGGGISILTHTIEFVKTKQVNRQCDKASLWRVSRVNSRLGKRIWHNITGPRLLYCQRKSQSGKEPRCLTLRPFSSWFPFQAVPDSLTTGHTAYATLEC